MTRFRMGAGAACMTCALALIVATPSRGATDQPNPIVFGNQDPNQKSLFTFDYGVPTSPALMLAGLSPDKTTTSTSLKPFVLSLPSLFGSDTNDQSAALDISPAWAGGKAMFIHDPYTVDDYRGDTQLTRILFRTRLGVAAYAGNDGIADAKKKKGSILALSLSTSILDDSDPLIAKDVSGNDAWHDCLVKSQPDFDAEVRQHNDPIDARLKRLKMDQSYVDDYPAQAGPPQDAASVERHKDFLERTGEYDQDLGGTGMSADEKANSNEIMLKIFYDKALQKKIDDVNLERNKWQDSSDAGKKAIAAMDKCAKSASDAAEYSQDLDIGAGVLWNGKAGKLDGFSKAGGAAWMGYRRPIIPKDANDPSSAYWVLGGSARYALNQSVATGVTATPSFTADIADIWVGLERRTDSLKFDAQYGYQDFRATSSSMSGFSKSGTRWLLSGAYKILSDDQDVWLGFSYGAADGTTGTLDDKTYKLYLNFGPPKLSSVFGLPDSSKKNDSGQ